MSKIEVTEENMEEIFNTEIYPKLDAEKDPAELGKLVNSILEKYEFKDEIMKVRIMIPVVDATTKATLSAVGLDENEMDQGIKQQIGWNFVQNWMMNGAFVPAKMINYGDLLNSASGEVFEDLYSLDPETKGWLQNEASFIVESVEKGEFEITDEQLSHIKDLKEGKFPFGFK